MLNRIPHDPVSLENVEALRRSLEGVFTVHDTTLDEPGPGYVRFRGHFLQEPARCYDALRHRFETVGFTPLIRAENGRLHLIALPLVFAAEKSNWIVNAALLILTIFSTLYTGALYSAESLDAVNLWEGLPFSLCIMLILGAHELGHYFAARYHKVPVTLPYFIPLPRYSLFGTLGAFIRLKAPVKNRRALFDVGAAGPLAGMVFAFPILVYGLATSEVGPIGPAGGLLEGNSILYSLTKLAIFGQMLPNNGIDVHLNQVAWAGWVGLLITGLNLLPLGQLDGGHIIYVLVGAQARKLFRPVIILLVGLSIFLALSDIWNAALTWMIWSVLLFFVGRHHAEPLDDVTLLDPRRRALAIFTLILFLLVFVPIPLQILQ